MCIQPEAAGAFETTICTRLFIDSKNINKVFESDFSTCGREGRKKRRWNRECGGDMMHRNIFTCVHISLVLASVAHLLCRFHALIHSNVKRNDTAGASKTLCWFFCFSLFLSFPLCFWHLTQFVDKVFDGTVAPDHATRINKLCWQIFHVWTDRNDNFIFSPSHNTCSQRISYR